MEQLDLFWQKAVDKQKLSQTPEIKKPVKEEKEKTQKKILSVLSWTFNYKFLNWNYESYKIETNNWKITKVYFKFWNHKFLIYIDYDLKSWKNINFHETDRDEREKIKENCINLKMSSIQKKEKAWYGWVKFSVNYFRYAWLDFFTTKNFLEALIKDYHK